MRDAEVIQTEIDDARIPQRFAKASLDTFETRTSALKELKKKAKKYVEEYSLENSKGLYIYGQTGVGKTHIAVGILKALIARGFEGVFYNVVDLLDAIRSTYDPKNSGIPKNRLERDLKRQIIVLDDFGMQKMSSWVADRLYALINRRYQDCKTIVITSNITMQDVRNSVQVDRSLASRIIDMCVEIEIKADDFRLDEVRSHQKRGRGRSRHAD